MHLYDVNTTSPFFYVKEMFMQEACMKKFTFMNNMFMNKASISRTCLWIFRTILYNEMFWGTSDILREGNNCVHIKCVLFESLPTASVV
jgi:hypothetical protein